MEKRDKFYWKMWSKHYSDEAYRACRQKTLQPIFALQVRAFERKVILRKSVEQLKKSWGV